MSPSTDRIERQILLNAPRSRVWRALSNAEEFGNWFGVALKGKTFVTGKPVQGQITYPGYQHLVWEVVIERLEAERLLSFRWHPYAVDPGVDYAKEPTTLVEFELKDAADGSLLRVVESGFDGVPLSRRLEAFRMNSAGWDEQMKNIERHVATPQRAFAEGAAEELVAVLCAGGVVSIAQLTSGTEITRQAVTKHLRVLADAGLVRDVKAGRERLWEFEPTQLDAARRSLDMIARQWDHALNKLKLAVER